MTTQNEMFFTRRIGHTVYKVRVAVPDTGQETMEDKILRMIKNEAGFVPLVYGIMEPPQMSRPA